MAKVTRSFLLSIPILMAAGVGCAGAGAESASQSESELSEDIVCTQAAAYPNRPFADIVRAEGGDLAPDGTPVIGNFTAWPAYAPGSTSGAYDPAIVAARDKPSDALDNIASRFGSCAPKIRSHVERRKPNVYIYFTGFGGETQDNSLIGDGAVLRWINKRDPKALIFSINWSCSNSHDSFCKDNAAKLRVTDASPEQRHMTETINAINPAALSTVQQILAMTDANQVGYNTALSHSMQLAALLVDQLLVADEADGGGSRLGDIHFLGYSMGAHAASQVLIQDFRGDGSGFKWTRPGQCDGGGDACTVAHLKKVKWSFSMGLSGWSEALASETAQGAGQGRAQYRNGGLFRVRDARFNGKANVFNRRMDPTGNSDDTFQRGFSDIFFSDYNHYSHDYSLPLFVDGGFTRALDAFLEADSVKNSPELGILYDNAGLVDFDDCPSEGKCNASTGYLAHASTRSHQEMTLVHTGPVTTTDGVAHPDRTKNRAASLASGSSPIALHTFDQEDLRGGVELYFRPRFDTASQGVHGLFSYGACGGVAEDLMPQAYVENGDVVFAVRYQGREYTARAPVGEGKLERDRWTHLAFTWELPVVSMSRLDSPTLQADLGKHGQALALAAGLRKALPTTYNRQEGAGTLRIYANGSPLVQAPLGAPDSKRDCLPAADVSSQSQYEVDGRTYPPFVPYARYVGDAVSAGGPPLGTMCKAYRVRNTRAFFGCARSQAVDADGDMDDIALVWGPGRQAYDNVDRQTGAPKNWPIGAEYGAKPYVAR